MERNEDNIRRLSELIKDIRVAMLTTLTDEGRLRMRPMVTQEADFDGTLWFLTNVHSGMVSELGSNAQVGVSYSEPDSNRYVSVVGRATLVRDLAKLDELWSPLYKAWFPRGKEDPDLTLIRVDVESAEYWDAPSGMAIKLMGFAESLVTGERYGAGGEHEKVTF